MAPRPCVRGSNASVPPSEPEPDAKGHPARATRTVSFWRGVKAALAWDIEDLVDRFGAHSHLLVIGRILDQQLRDLLRGPVCEEPGFHVVVKFPECCQLTGRARAAVAAPGRRRAGIRARSGCCV